MSQAPEKKFGKVVVGLTGLRELIKMQGLEDAIGIAERQMKSIPEFKELKALKQDIENGQAEIYRLKEELAVNRRDLREVEDLVASLKEKIGRVSDELYSGETTNIKALEATEKNVAAIKENIAANEENALRLMEVLETSEKRLNQLVGQLDIKKNEFRRLNKYYNDKKLVLAQTLMNLNSEKEQVTASVEPELLARFKKLAAAYDDRKPVAVLEDGICSGCHMAVSFDLRRQAKIEGEYLTCDNCGRMLVVD